MESYICDSFLILVSAEKQTQESNRWKLKHQLIARLGLDLWLNHTLWYFSKLTFPIYLSPPSSLDLERGIQGRTCPTLRGLVLIYTPSGTKREGRETGNVTDYSQVVFLNLTGTQITHNKYSFLRYHRALKKIREIFRYSCSPREK